MFSIALLGVAVVIVAEGGLAILGVERAAADASRGATIIAGGQSDLQNAPYIVFAPSFCHLLHRALAELPRRRRAGPLRRAGERPVSPRRRAEAERRRAVRRRAARRPAARGRRPPHAASRPTAALVHAVDGVSFIARAGQDARRRRRVGLRASRCCRARSWACCPKQRRCARAASCSRATRSSTRAPTSCARSGARRCRWCSRTR